MSMTAIELPITKKDMDSMIIATVSETKTLFKKLLFLGTKFSILLASKPKKFLALVAVITSTWANIEIPEVGYIILLF